MITKTRQEVLCLWDEKRHLVAVMVKNGETGYYKTKKFGFEDHTNLYEDLPDLPVPKGAVIIHENETHN